MGALRAGFAEVDITPPIGTHKIGWLIDAVPDRVLDPLHARVLAMESGGRRPSGRLVGLIQLDTLSVRWTQVADIRRRIAERCGRPADGVMVAATHNHAGPAIANCGDVLRDDAYAEHLIAKVVECFGRAVDGMVEAEVAFGQSFEFAVAHNRRIVMRDGTVSTHGTFDDPDALYVEGPIDPEVAAMAVRARGGGLLGTVVNSARHPTHHGAETTFSGGFPGVLAAEMESRGCPATLFLNGACGNITDLDPARGGERLTKEEIGRMLADDASSALEDAEFVAELTLGARSETVQLPFREPTEEQIAGTVRGAQRFVDPTVYDRVIPGLVERIRRMGTQPAEVQALFVGDRALVSIPAEYFVEHGLRIKQESHPARALVVSHANGMVGYVPTRAAFERGGYETTFCTSSRLAPEAGDILADCAIRLVTAGP